MKRRALSGEVSLGRATRRRSGFASASSIALAACFLLNGCAHRTRAGGLQTVSVPVYPGAQGVVRQVSPHLPQTLIVQYRARVAYPSEAVPEFCEKELLAQGWEATVSTPPTQGDRRWNSLADTGGVFPKAKPGHVSHDFGATWRNAKLDLTLTLQIVATGGTNYQDVIINVRHPAQPLVTLGLRHLGGRR